MFDFVSYSDAVRSIFTKLRSKLAAVISESRIIVNDDDISRLATAWEIEHPLYDHDRLVREIKHVMREAVKQDKCIFIGRGYFDVTEIVKNAAAYLYRTLAEAYAEEMRGGQTGLWRAEAMQFYLAQLERLSGEEHDPNDLYPVSEPETQQQ